jgi:hypothetical protein
LHVKAAAVSASERLPSYEPRGVRKKYEYVESAAFIENSRYLPQPLNEVRHPPLKFAKFSEKLPLKWKVFLFFSDLFP